MEDTHVSYLEGEIRALNKRVEDLRNVGKMIRGNADAKAAAEALDKRIEDLESEKADLRGKVAELEARVEHSVDRAAEAQTVAVVDTAKEIRAVVEEIDRLRKEAVETVQKTPGAMRSRLDVDTRMWAHPFVERALHEVINRIEKVFGGQ